MKDGMHILNVWLGLFLGVEGIFILVKSVRPEHHLPVWFSGFVLYIVASASVTSILQKRYSAIRANLQRDSVARFNRDAILFFRVSIVFYLVGAVANVIATW